MRIEPIEGILGCESVSFNRQAVDQPWVARHAGRAPSGVVRRGSERWKPRDRTVGPTGDVRIRSSRAGSPSRKAQGVRTGREPGATDRSREEAVAAKNRVIDVSTARREPQSTRKTDGVR
jgi:hypothetical protein